MFMDAPEHTRLRGLCAVAFTPKRVEVLRQRVAAEAEALLDRVAARGGMEVVGEYASPLPGLAITALLGVPAADHARLKKLTNSLGELMGNFDHESERLRASVASMKELQAYLQAVVEEQRATPDRTLGGVPCDGLIAALLSSEMEGARLTDDEVVANVILILTGGLEETSNLIGGAVLHLLRSPESLAELRAEPGIIGPAVEELLRYHSPTQHTGRIAPEDMVLGGKTVRKGDSVTIVLAAANRDPRRFAEPERLDLRREENKHLAFGYAAHYCMGAPLTRMTAQIALTALLRRLPGLALAAEPVWRPNMGLRGLESLRVTFHTQTGAV
jgi:cytochrome P450